MTITQPLLTADAFSVLPMMPGERYELVRGEAVEVSAAAISHARIARRLQQRLEAFALAHDLGEVFPDGPGYILSRHPDTVRVPDVSFIAAVHALPDDFKGFAPFAPDLAVEVVSSTDRARDVDAKAQEYLAAGTQLVWVVRPDDQMVCVHTADGEQELRVGDELDGGDLLPGFRLPVAELFTVRR